MRESGSLPVLRGFCPIWGTKSPQLSSEWIMLCGTILEPGALVIPDSIDDTSRTEFPDVSTWDPAVVLVD